MNLVTRFKIGVLVCLALISCSGSPMQIVSEEAYRDRSCWYDHKENFEAIVMFTENVGEGDGSVIPLDLSARCVPDGSKRPSGDGDFFNLNIMLIEDKKGVIGRELGTVVASGMSSEVVLPSDDSAIFFLKAEVDRTGPEGRIVIPTKVITFRKLPSDFGSFLDMSAEQRRKIIRG